MIADVRRYPTVEVDQLSETERGEGGFGVYRLALRAGQEMEAGMVSRCGV